MTEEIHKARSTAPSRKSSGIESGGSKQLSGQTQRDLVHSHCNLQESTAPSKSGRAQSRVSSLRSLSLQRGRQLGTYCVKSTHDQDRAKTWLRSGCSQE